MILKPGWTSPTHSAVFEAIEEILSAKSITYNHLTSTVRQELKIHSKIFFRIKAIFLTVSWHLKGRDRNALWENGICLSHSVAEWSIRLSETGKFRILSWKTVRQIEIALANINLLPKLLEKSKIHLVIGGDEGYGASIILQIAVIKKVPILHLKEIRRQVYLFDFNATLLYSGPNYYNFQLAQAGNSSIRSKITDLENRIHGNYRSLSYMREVSGDAPQANDDTSFDVILFLHDFIDSPGIYGENIFLDQWDWIKRSIKLAKQNSLSMAIKSHPNLHSRNSKALEQLTNLCHKNDIGFLSPSIALSQLKNVRILLTMFGSVVEEAAYQNIPCLTSSHHPFVWTPMCRNAKTLQEFDDHFNFIVNNKFQLGLSDLQIAHYSVSNEINLQQYWIGNFNFDDVDEFSRKSILQLPEKFGINERRAHFLNVEKNSIQYDRLFRYTKNSAKSQIINSHCSIINQQLPTTMLYE